MHWAVSSVDSTPALQTLGEQHIPVLFRPLLDLFEKLDARVLVTLAPRRDKHSRKLVLRFIRHTAEDVLKVASSVTPFLREESEHLRLRNSLAAAPCSSESPIRKLPIGVSAMCLNTLD